MKSTAIPNIILGMFVVIAAWAWWPRTAAPRKPGSTAPAPAPRPQVARADPHAPNPKAIEPETSRHNATVALDIERALVSRDARQRETAFNYLLPELLQAEPGRVIAMLARQEPGDARDTLRTEIARAWIRRDRDAAVAWLATLSGDEQRTGAAAAIDSLAAVAPDQAISVADRFGIGRDDGSLEHLVQIWATDDLDAAERWIATQPEGAGSDPLRARIALVREQKAAARAPVVSD